jgi:hypothetical protein
LEYQTPAALHGLNRFSKNLTAFDHGAGLRVAHQVETGEADVIARPSAPAMIPQPLPSI